MLQILMQRTSWRHYKKNPFHQHCSSHHISFLSFVHSFVHFCFLSLTLTHHDDPYRTASLRYRRLLLLLLLLSISDYLYHCYWMHCQKLFDFWVWIIKCINRSFISFLMTGFRFPWTCRSGRWEEGWDDRVEGVGVRRGICGTKCEDDGGIRSTGNECIRAFV